MSSYLWGHSPAAFTQCPRAPQRYDAGLKPEARGWCWTFDHPHEFDQHPPTEPLRYATKPTVDGTWDEPYLEFYQSKPISFQHDFSQPIARPPYLEPPTRENFHEHQIQLLFGANWNTNPISTPHHWFAPRFPASPSDPLEYVPDWDLTVAIYDILRWANINPRSLRNFFCLVPDPDGCGPLTYTHPIMRRVAAIAYCVHYPTMHGLVYDVARECGRARAQQSEPYFINSMQQTEVIQQRYHAAELWALSPTAEPHTITGDRFASANDTDPGIYSSPVAVRIQLAHAWFGHLQDPHNIPLGEFDPDDPFSGVQNPWGGHMYQPISVPWECRTAYIGFSEHNCMGPGTPANVHAERTAWTTRAVDRLLRWASDRPGLVLTPVPPAPAPRSPDRFDPAGATS